MNEYYNLICNRLNQKKQEYNERSDSFGIMTDNDLGRGKNNYESNAIAALVPLAELSAVIRELEFLKTAYEAMANTPKN